ncbi:MAG: 2-dehydro-3-deoxygalactonokinase [Phenylobacterium sp.]
MAAALLACDWGTTNLRAWTLDEAGEVLLERDFPLGVSRLAAGEAQRRFESEVRPAMRAEGLPAVLCGMVGSNLGWTVVPYLDCPARASDLCSAMVEPAPGVRIAPGLRCRGIAGAPDVMRGEEVQVFGWLAGDEARRRGRRLLCHPGTHAKWILIEDETIVRFVTVMTGELFAVLGKHSVLKSEAKADDEAAFDAGLAAAGDGGGLAARLFSARSRVVGGGEAAESTPSYLSGLLIGAEVASAPGLLGLPADTAVDLLGDAGLTRWYERALRARGVRVQTYDGESAAVAGLFALFQTEAA